MLTLKDKIQQSKKSQIKWKIYFFSLLILSNLAVFFITKSEYENEQVLPTQNKSQINNHQNFTQITLRLKTNLNDFSFHQNESRSVFLLTPNGEAIIKNAYYLKKIPSETTEENYFNIEISNEEYIKLVQIKAQDLILIKASQYQLKKINHAKGDRYEMVF